MGPSMQGTSRSSTDEEARLTVPAVIKGTPPADRFLRIMIKKILHKGCIVRQSWNSWNRYKKRKNCFFLFCGSITHRRVVSQSATCDITGRQSCLSGFPFLLPVAQWKTPAPCSTPLSVDNGNQAASASPSRRFKTSSRL